MEQLVLSLFPGADLFGMAFEKVGFCVVRGPDILLGGDVRKFKGIKGKFDGIIGGPPCQPFSEAYTTGECSSENLIPEFERIVKECKPRWWVMENVRNSPLPELFPRYSVVVDAYRFGARQHRRRKITTNLPLRLRRMFELELNPLPCITATEYKGCATDTRRASRQLGRRLTLDEVKWGMGIDYTFNTPALTSEYKYKVLGNGVPLELGITIAEAVKVYLETPIREYK